MQHSHRPLNKDRDGSLNLHCNTTIIALISSMEFTSKNIIATLNPVHPNDPVPKQERSSLIYLIPYKSRYQLHKGEANQYVIRTLTK